MPDPLSRLLADRPYVLADGAMSTNLAATGVASGGAPELCNVDAPDAVRRVHAEFVGAGADVLLTNTFGANAARLRAIGSARRVRELNAAAVALARDAAGDAARAGRSVVVAGSMGPTGSLGPEDASRAGEVFAEQAAALAESGVDVLWLETFTALAELRSAAAAAAATGLPFVATMSFAEDARTPTGDPAAGLAATCASLAVPPIAFGANCGAGPASLVEALRALRSASPGGVLVAKGNCGAPERVGGRLVHPASPAVLARCARLARDAGARVIGACCGATAAHVRAIAAALDGYAPGALPPTAAGVAAALAADA